MSEKMSTEEKRDWHAILGAAGIALAASVVLTTVVPFLRDALEPVLADVLRQVSDFTTPPQLR